jgi:predicted metal-dependent HD superfamily phosphohydrolase
MDSLVKQTFLKLFDKKDSAKALDVFLYIEKRYSEPHRFYHTMTHINDCLLEVLKMKSSFDNIKSVIMALFFHDIVYDSESNSNELDSAILMKKMLTPFNFDDSFLSIVYDLIVDTKHPSKPNTQDSYLLIDIDLLILSSNKEKFDKYNDDIRKEFSWVPDDVFYFERKKFLRNLMIYGNIYKSNVFFHLNEKARTNILKVLY